jgi:hypothetical protein
VHPLEEAEAYERLMAADSLVTADTIAAKVGKSATYVYLRLMLLRLQPGIRDAFRRDIITAAHAQRLATVLADRQPEAFARCFSICPKGLVCLGCTHAQPKQSAAPIFRRMLVSHERALGTARHHEEPAGQIAARQLEVSRITHALRRAVELPSDVAAAIEGEA